jgi:hypothetical protein
MMVLDMTTSPKDKSLAHFLETIHRNQQCIQDRFSERYRTIQRVDDCFAAAAGKHLRDVKPMFTGPMFLRSHYAYKTAAGMTLAGQFCESFVLMRSCLEYAGYAIRLFTDPNLEEVFLNRHADKASKNALRKNFEISSITNAIAGFDKKLSEIFKDMYERSIDFGGHPNPHAMFGAANINKDDDNKLTSMSTFAFSVNPKTIEFAMHKVAQVGLTTLCIFEHMFKGKFELLGIRARIDELKESGL